MAEVKQSLSSEIKNGAKELADSAHENKWVDTITRVGYAVRGLIYGVIGFLAAKVLTTGQGEITDQNGALARIAEQPYGKVLLIVTLVGLVGLTIWGVVRAVADPYHKGKDFKGLVSRAGYLISGITYGLLLFPVLRELNGGGGQSSSSAQAESLSARIMSHPLGPWLIGLVGLVLIGVGLYRIYLGVKGKLNERLKSYKMSEEQRKIAVRAGRVGYIAHGVVLGLIGTLALLAALTLDPQRVGGLDQALLFLSQQTYGTWLLGALALGLIAYAVYSFMGAIWFRIKEL